MTKTYVGKKQRKPYEIIFHASDWQDPSTILSNSLASAQQYLFKQKAGPNDDAEIRVIDVASGHVLAGYFYRHANGEWKLIRSLEVA